MDELTQSLVKKLFIYSHGMLFHKVPKQAIKKGSRAGTQRSDGYRIVRVNNKQEYEHRIIFLYHHGYMPILIDHKNGDKKCNCISNLREANHSLNNHNSRKCESQSGIRGVYYDRRYKRWQARITINKKPIIIGSSADFFEACCFRISYENKVLGKFSPRL